MAVDNETALKQVSLMIKKPSLTQLGSGRLTAVLHGTVATWLGNAAAVLSGPWGAVPRRGRARGGATQCRESHSRLHPGPARGTSRRARTGWEEQVRRPWARKRAAQGRKRRA